jgi:ribbon-helix-helix CopG family protein
MYGTMYGSMARMLKTTVYLTPELKARLERVASEHGQSEAEVIRAAIEAFTPVQRRRPRLPLFHSGKPIEDWDEAMKGFGED